VLLVLSSRGVSVLAAVQHFGCSGANWYEINRQIMAYRNGNKVSSYRPGVYRREINGISEIIGLGRITETYQK
jgi:hypothetical protein